ncbi:TPA: helix-turn-helix domain-containing protein [Enterobacter kobei]|nr:helix-turn-helix domain-containing protein [Enterobacter kobei]
MSVKLSAWVWDGCAAQGVKGIKLLVMARLADFSSDEGICWPSVATIVRQVGAGRSTVITAISDLEKEGWLTRTERRKGQRSDTNLYTLNTQKLRAAAAHLHGPVPEHSESGHPANTGAGGDHDSVSERSDSECSDSGRPENMKKGGSEGSESGHDPSLTTDPSLNPIRNAREAHEVEPVNLAPVPDYPNQPGTAFPSGPVLGKFPMSPEWSPSADFRKRAALWGFPVPEGLDRASLIAALTAFRDYWIAEAKVFSQVQWEQKFARNLQVRPTQHRGNNHAGLDPNSTANPTVQRIRAARAEWERNRAAERMEVLGDGGGRVFEQVGRQERYSAIGPVDCPDWELDQRPDDERMQGDG